MNCKSLVWVPFFFVAACGSSGSGGANSPTYSVIGEWDVEAVNGKAESSGTLTIRPDGFLLDADGALIDFSVDGETGEVAYEPSGESYDNNIERTPTDVQGGIVPFPIGGAWKFQAKDNDDASCNLSVEESKVSSTCDLRKLGLKLSKSWTARKTSEGTSSIFGNLTGKWRFSNEGESAEITFDGSTLSIADEDDEEAFSITFSQDRASGTVAHGGEIAAKRK